MLTSPETDIMPPSPSENYERHTCKELWDQMESRGLKVQKHKNTADCIRDLLDSDARKGRAPSDYSTWHGDELRTEMRRRDLKPHRVKMDYINELRKADGIGIDLSLHIGLISMF